MWHEAQSIAWLLKMPFEWHELQVVLTCAPVSGKLVALWLYVAPVHAVVVWQVAHWLDWKPAAVWFSDAPE